MARSIYQLLVISFLFFSLNMFSQKKKETDVLTVLFNMKLQEDAWNEGDVRRFMNYYWNNDSLKFIGSKGVTYGWKNTLDNYLKSYPNKEAMGRLDFTVIENTQVSKNYIYVIGKWELKKEKPLSGYFTLLWKKIKNEWVIISDHTS